MKYKRLSPKHKISDIVKEYEKQGTSVIWSSCTVCGVTLVDLLDRLAELENKIENGTLIELPCKVGDTVYMIWIERLDENYAPIYKIQSGKIFSIQLENKDGQLDIWLRVGFGLTYRCRRIKDFCLTKAEAEQRLKELKDER